MIQTLEWTDKGVRFIDQTKLPMEEVYVTCKTHEQVADVIRNMVVRGAPAIGVAAAMGIALGVNNSKAESSGELKRDLDQICDLIGRTRPTAVNLFWAIRRMQEKFERIRIRPIPQIKQDLIEEAQRMHAEDIAANQAMGRHGATLMPSTGGVLTHCNAGALATAGYGTALGVTRATLRLLTLLDSYACRWRSFQEPFFDSCGVMREVVISIMATLAQQERIAISERTKAGLQRAVKAGRVLGRRPVAVDIASARKLQGQGMGLRPNAKHLRVSVNTLTRALRKAA